MVILGANTAAMSAVEQTNVIKVDELNHYHEDWVPPFAFRDGVRIKTTEKFSDYYNLYDEIGEGKFGKVYRCVEKATNLILAAKCIRLKRDADIEKVEKEINIMTQMRHKCIAQIYDAFATSTNDVVLIMEIVEGGELFDRVVDENYILTETAVAMIVYQICEAIRYIHSQNIIHLDLKPENIMCLTLTGNQIKLIDFGLAQYYDGQSDLMFMAGTPEFAAPEVIKYEPLDFHTDMWSVGVITYILLSGQSPFLGENIAHTYCNVERGKWEFCEEFDENCISVEGKDFITKLLVVDKYKRMSAEECLQHSWLIHFLEKSQNNNNINNEKQLHVVKLRSYVRNKRFRRVVFGVLFVNTIIKMFNTLQDRKSDHGIEYVKNMLNAVNTDDSKQLNDINLITKLFSKRKRSDQNYENTPSTSSASYNNNTEPNTTILANTKIAESKNNATGGVKSKINAKNNNNDLNKSLSGEELHKKAKRINYQSITNDLLNNDKLLTIPQTDCKQALLQTQQQNATTSSSSGVEEDDVCEDGILNHEKKKEISQKKSKRVKATSRKTSSTEHAPEKRTKTSATSNELIHSTKQNLKLRCSKSRDSSPLNELTISTELTTKQNNDNKNLKLECSKNSDSSPSNNLATTNKSTIKQSNNTEKLTKSCDSNSFQQVKKLSNNLLKFEQNNNKPFQLPVACATTLPIKTNEKLNLNENECTNITKKVIITPVTNNIDTTDNKDIANPIVKKTIVKKKKKDANENFNDNKNFKNNERIKILSATKFNPTILVETKIEKLNDNFSKTPTQTTKNIIKDDLVKPKISLNIKNLNEENNTITLDNIDFEKTSNSEQIKTFFGIELKSTKNSISDNIQQNKIKVKTDQNNKSAKNSVNLLLEKIEQNNNDTDAIKMMVTDYIPILTKPIRHDSVENLSFQNDIKNESIKAKCKLYNQIQNKTTELSLGTNEINTDEKKNEKVLSIKHKSTTVTEQKLLLKKVSTKKMTTTGNNSSIKQNVIDLESSNVTELSQNLHTKITMKKKDESKEQKLIIDNENHVLDANYNKSLMLVETNNIKMNPNNSYNTVTKKQITETNCFDLEHKQTKKEVETNKQKIHLKTKSKNKLLTNNNESKTDSTTTLINESNIKAKVVNFKKEETLSETNHNLIINNILNSDKSKKKLVKKVLISKKKLRRRSLGTPTQEQDNSSKITCSLIDLNKTNLNENCLNKTLKWTVLQTQSNSTLQNENSEEETTHFKQKNNANKQNESKIEKHKKQIEETTDSLNLEHDAFDFSMLRLKLQQRIMGIKDDNDLAAEAENRQKCDFRVQLQSSATIKQTMNKWQTMDKNLSKM